ncbi:hypothetical protein D9Q98_000045 [Chlorella vulgaris]|uniref:Proteasome endopeptidase complex n=1 Tax=Chlorella vulgaris TaxID=3077 RepID=A0A9D4TXG6_CHLVU|nr:hypothetical protein D9Q98_000045 [Chlorella vulgaris]
MHGADDGQGPKPPGQPAPDGLEQNLPAAAASEEPAAAPAAGAAADEWEDEVNEVDEAAAAGAAEWEEDALYEVELDDDFYPHHFNHYDYDDDDLTDEDEYDEDDEDWDSEDEAMGMHPYLAAHADQMAEQTADIHMCSEWAAYAIPTHRAHFQAADALAVARLPPNTATGSSGGVLAATLEAQGVAAWLLPAAGEVGRLGPASEPAAVRLGGFQILRDVYSIAISPDCRYIASGGEGGLLTLYSLDPSAPPRPLVPSQCPSMSTHDYFYTPLMLPVVGKANQVVHRGELQPQGQQQRPGARYDPQILFEHSPGGMRRQDWDTQRFLNEMGLRIRGMGTAAELVDGPPQPAGLTPMYDDARLPGDPVRTQSLHFLEAVMGQDVSALEAEYQRSLASGTDSQGKQPAGEAARRQDTQQAQREVQSPHAAVMLRGAFALGLEGAQAGPVPLLSDGMCNGVRFGLVAGRQRLIAADQSGYIYIFELPEASPSASSDGNLQAQQLLCSGLGESSPHWRMRPVNFLEASQHALGARVSLQEQQDEAQTPWFQLLTAAVGPLPMPCNLAVASPDGRWIAVVGDAPAVYLLDQAAGFTRRMLPLCADGVIAVMADREPGAQYVAWNSSSTLIAVTSDALRSVCVFDAPSGQMVMHMECHRYPCLPVNFAPWDDRLLVYAEEAVSIHLRTVPPPAKPAEAASSGGPGGCSQHNVERELVGQKVQPGTQLLRIPELSGVSRPSIWHNGEHLRRVTGMASTADGELMVTSLQGALIRYVSPAGWCHEQHARWPPAFRAAVKTLLLCAHRQGSAASGVWDLPPVLLQTIVELAAGKRTDWMEAHAQPPPATSAVRAHEMAAALPMRATVASKGAEPKQHAAWSPYDDNGGTVVAVGGNDYCIVAASTRMSTGYSILTRNKSKVLQLNPKCVIASAGMQADMEALHKKLHTQHVMYQFNHRKPMACPAMAQLLSNTLYQKRFFPFYTFNLCAGLDDEGRGAVYTYDAIGSYERVGYGVQGSGKELIQPVLDNQLKAASPLVLPQQQWLSSLPLDQAVDLVKGAFVSAGERDIYTGDDVEILIITKDGVRVDSLGLKRD